RRYLKRGLHQTYDTRPESIIELMIRVAEGRRAPSWDGRGDIPPENLTRIALSDGDDSTYPWRRLVLDLYLISNLEHSDEQVQAEAVKALARQTSFVRNLVADENERNTAAELISNFAQKYRSDLVAAVLAMDPDYDFPAPPVAQLAQFDRF